MTGGASRIRTYATSRLYGLATRCITALPLLRILLERNLVVVLGRVGYADDLVTRNGQAIGSGMYLYSIEFIGIGNGVSNRESEIGKFVIIK